MRHKAPKDCTLLHRCTCPRCKRRKELSPLIKEARARLGNLENELGRTYRPDWKPSDCEERRQCTITCGYCGHELDAEGEPLYP